MSSPEISNSQMIAVGILSLLCFAVGTMANFLSLIYFLLRNRTRCTLSKTLFNLINGTDLLICLLALPVAISALSEGQPKVFSLPFFCNSWVFLWYTLCRYSLFLIAVLSIARTHSMVRPLCPPDKRWVLVPVLVYLLLLLVQETFPYWYGNSAHYDSNVLSCVWFIAGSVPLNSIEHTLYHMVFVVIETGCPIVIIMASSVYSCVYLHAKQRKRSFILHGLQRQSVAKGSSRLLSSLKKMGQGEISVASEVRPEQSAGLRSKSASVTIVIIGGACFFLNIPFLLLILLSQVEHFTDCTMICLADSISHDYIFLFMFLVHTGTMEINSVINPFIYIARTKRLREFISNTIFKCDFSSVR